MISLPHHLRDKLEFDCQKNLEETIQKEGICYEQSQDCNIPYVKPLAI